MDVVVARIGRPQGLRGEVSVEVRTDDPAGRLRLGASLSTDPASAGPLVIRSVRDQSGRTILGFDGVDDRTAAEGLRGLLLLVDAADDEPAEDEWPDHVLVGLVAERLDGASLGEVVAVQHLPAQDLLVVRPAAGGEDVLVPFVRALVPEVDVPAGRVVMDPPGGLFEPADDSDESDDTDDE